MIISVSGAFYVYETEVNPTREELTVFFQDLNENDILEVRVRPDSGNDIQIYHVSKFYLENHLEFKNLALPKRENTFELASGLCPQNAIMPVIDDAGNCVNLIKKIPTYYQHFYQYEGELDLSFLNRYNSIVLMGLNEYSVELYKKAIPVWSGEEIFLIGEEWRDYLDVLPTLPNVRVTIMNQLAEWKRLPAEREAVEKKMLYIVEGLPGNEDNSRYEQGIMYYDEIMTLTFMFSHVIHPGTGNPHRKFFLIDGFFRIEGIFGIWLKVFTAARYALAKGYLPVFIIVSSDCSIYSDHQGDDIWNKFFLQPGDYTLQEVCESSYLALSANMNVMNTVRYIMDGVSNGKELLWPNGIFNSRVKEYIKKRQKQFLPCPAKTLGVLIRGTDYIHNPLPNHAKHAAVEQVIDKISEIEDKWEFDRIYLATEDKDICLRMKEQYGNRIDFTDQERYTVEPGHLLAELHQEKKEGEGFRLGAEYLCSVSLLSQCSSLIASGNCGALSEALRANGGNYKNVFIFGC